MTGGGSEDDLERHFEHGNGRPIPIVRMGNAPYWTGGGVGELRIQQCQACLRLVHPPAILCPYDHQRDLVWTVVSGNGRVESWTECRYTWVFGLHAPYLIAIVSLDEDPGARLLTNLVGTSAAAVTMGMPVGVRFIELGYGDEQVFLPVFGPLNDAEAVAP
jgi:uncharacterized OB-fold protein